MGILAGCGGAGTPTAETPSTGAQIADSGGTALELEESPDLSPVPAPAELVAVARWSKPGVTADTLMAWTNLPFDWRRLLQAKEPDLAAAVALDAPLEAAVALAPDPAKRFEQPHAVFSLGLNSLSQALDFIRNKGESLRKVSAGVYVIEDGGELSCAVAASVGPTPARLVCGERPADVDALLPYVTRGLPNEELGGGEIHLEVRAEPFRQAYGRQLRQLKSAGLALQLRKLQLGSPRFDRALADAAHGLADELLLLLDDLDRVSLDLNANSGTAELEFFLSATFRGSQSWSVQSTHEAAARSGVAPDLFWRLPSDVARATYGVSGDPKRFAEIRRTLAELLDGYLAYEKLPGGVRDQIVRIIEDTWISAGHTVSAEGNVDPLPDQKRNEADQQRETARRELGWMLMGFEEQPARVKAYLDRLIKAYRDPQLRRFLQTRLKVEKSELPRIKVGRATGRGLAPGSTVYELAVPGEAFSHYSFDDNKLIKGRPLPVYLVVMPDGAITWVAFSADRDVVYEKLALVRQGGSRATLAGRSGLGELKRERAVSGGFMTLAGLLGPGLLGGVLPDKVDFSAALERAPHRGETPILGFSTIERTGSTTQVRVRLRVPKAVVEDAVAALDQDDRSEQETRWRRGCRRDSAAADPRPGRCIESAIRPTRVGRLLLAGPMMAEIYENLVQCAAPCNQHTYSVGESPTFPGSGVGDGDRDAGAWRPRLDRNLGAVRLRHGRSRA